MEPMALGSPPSSPASPAVNPGFLPNFLIGEPQSPQQIMTSASPGRNKTAGPTVKSNLNTTEPQSLRQKLFNQSLSDTPVQHTPFVTTSEKAGPPKLGLFDTLEQNKSPILSSTIANINESVGFNQSISRIHMNSTDDVSRHMSESFNRSAVNNYSRHDKIDSLWVTVFGFPPSVLMQVLSEISNCGVIVDKKVPSQGNWVHIKFNNPTEVSRVLSLNGKCLHNNIMIGVQLHYDRSNRENKENDNTMYTSPVRARSLRHSFVSPQNASAVLSPQAVPQKSTGIVTKAMEYVFGW